ncbi:MAG: hypothetical protein JOZ41_01370 [Chloroflexi bacterium]|nr:hypothetical protein [Chloroflexota bacterium]
MKRLILALITAAALSLPAIGAHANQNNTNGCPNQNMVVVNGVCVKQNHN